jgi:hypothetical protein
MKDITNFTWFGAEIFSLNNCVKPIYAESGENLNEEDCEIEFYTINQDLEELEFLERDKSFSFLSLQSMGDQVLMSKAKMMFLRGIDSSRSFKYPLEGKIMKMSLPNADYIDEIYELSDRIHFYTQNMERAERKIIQQMKKTKNQCSLKLWDNETGNIKIEYLKNSSFFMIRHFSDTDSNERIESVDENCNRSLFYDNGDSWSNPYQLGGTFYYYKGEELTVLYQGRNLSLPKGENGILFSHEDYVLFSKIPEEGQAILIKKYDFSTGEISKIKQEDIIYTCNDHSQYFGCEDSDMREVGGRLMRAYAFENGFYSYYDRFLTDSGVSYMNNYFSQGANGEIEGETIFYGGWQGGKFDHMERLRNTKYTHHLHKHVIGEKSLVLIGE